MPVPIDHPLKNCLTIAAACHAGCCQDLSGALRSPAQECFVAWRGAMINNNWQLRVQTITGIVSSVQVPNLLEVWPQILRGAGTVLKYVHTLWGLSTRDEISFSVRTLAILKSESARVKPQGCQSRRHGGGGQMANGLSSGRLGWGTTSNPSDFYSIRNIKMFHL